MSTTAMSLASSRLAKSVSAVQSIQKTKDVRFFSCCRVGDLTSGRHNHSPSSRPSRQNPLVCPHRIVPKGKIAILMTRRASIGARSMKGFGHTPDRIARMGSFIQPSYDGMARRWHRRRPGRPHLVSGRGPQRGPTGPSSQRIGEGRLASLIKHAPIISNYRLVC